MNLPYDNKVIGKVLSTATQPLISCPIGKQIVIKSINMANTTTEGVSVIIKFWDASAEQEFDLANGVVIYDDTVFELVSNLINLEEGDEIRASASSAGTCHAVISYLQIS